MDIRWTWDPRKAAANRAKHGVSFELALPVLDDPLALSLPDPHPAKIRWRLIGRPVPGLPTLLLVIHTEPVESDAAGLAVGRIMSARRATAAERRVYEQDH